MTFKSKLGQIIDIMKGGFTLPTEEEVRLKHVSTILSASTSEDKQTLNHVLNLAQGVQEAFNAIPEGRSVEIETHGHGTLNLKKLNGKVQIV